MKISKIIEELTELKEYIGDKDLEACIANSITTGVNVMYKNDDGGITSTSLEGEKLVKQMKATMNDPSVLTELKESKLPYEATPDYAPISFKVVFQGIPGVCEPQTIEMKIPRSQNPKEPSLSITYEEYPLISKAIKEEMDKFKSEVAVLLAEKDKNASKTIEKFNDWNDVSNTKIPLNEEIFALLEDRMNPKRLRPEVIIAHMYPAKRLLWTEQTVGDVLCYDVPAGNFHCCNGNQIKYWKYVNVPR